MASVRSPARTATTNVALTSGLLYWPAKRIQILVGGAPGLYLFIYRLAVGGHQPETPALKHDLVIGAEAKVRGAGGNQGGALHSQLAVLHLEFGDGIVREL